MTITLIKASHSPCRLHQCQNSWKEYHGILVVEELFYICEEGLDEGDSHCWILWMGSVASNCMRGRYGYHGHAVVLKRDEYIQVLKHHILRQRFPNLVLGAPRGAHFVFCPNTTQLIQMIKAWWLVYYLNQKCSARAKKWLEIGWLELWMLIGWQPWYTVCFSLPAVPSGWRFGTVEWSHSNRQAQIPYLKWCKIVIDHRSALLCLFQSQRCDLWWLICVMARFDS